MNRLAVYPGSFDPVTNGHVDLVKRASRMFDRVLIAVVDNPQKEAAFSVKERMEMLELSTMNIKNARVAHFQGLLVDFMKEVKAKVLIRGLREVSDFEYEFQMALMNRRLDSSVETVFLMPAEAYTYLSSSLIKEVAALGGNINGLVPKEIMKYLKKLK